MSKHLPIILHPNNTDFLVVNKFMHHGDFFFDVIVKAMAQHLLLSGRIKVGLSGESPRMLHNVIFLLPGRKLKRFKLV